MDKFKKYLNEEKYDKREMLRDIKSLNRRIKEIEAIIKADESPFQALSYLRSDIKEIMEKVGVYKSIDPRYSNME